MESVLHACSALLLFCSVLECFTFASTPFQTLIPLTPLRVSRAPLPWGLVYALFVLLNQTSVLTAKIEREKSGIAHITAETELEANYGLGYAHAQDRFASQYFH